MWPAAWSLTGWNSLWGSVSSQQRITEQIWSQRMSWMWLRPFPQDQQLDYERPWSSFHLAEITLWGVLALRSTSDALLFLFKHWNCVPPYCCLPLFFFFHNAAARKLQESRRSAEMINFWGNPHVARLLFISLTSPPPPTYSNFQ